VVWRVGVAHEGVDDCVEWVTSRDWTECAAYTSSLQLDDKGFATANGDSTVPVLCEKLQGVYFY
jgi:hypothetical protein